VPGGVGTWALEGEGYTVGALVVVNAVGDVADDAGRIIAGARADDGGFFDIARALSRAQLDPATLQRLSANGPGSNTTLAVVATDAPLTRTGLETLARAAATGMARRIVPVNTPFDGDVTFAVSTAPEAVELPSSVLLVLGILGAEALARAIERAVTAAA